MDGDYVSFLTDNSDEFVHLLFHSDSCHDIYGDEGDGKDKAYKLITPAGQLDWSNVMLDVDSVSFLLE